MNSVPLWHDHIIMVSWGDFSDLIDLWMMLDPVERKDALIEAFDCYITYADQSMLSSEQKQVWTDIYLATEREILSNG